MNLRVRVNMEVIAIKRYSILPAAPELDAIYCHTQDTLLGGF